MKSTHSGDSDRVSAIFSTALKLPAGERRDYIQQAALGDEKIIAEVEDLLRFDSSLDGFLEHSLVDSLEALSLRTSALPEGELLKGRYRIDQQHSRSGFATVYFATDQLLAGKRVVVKVLDQVRSGHLLETSFASEVGALTSVHHPNVVGLTDIGTLANEAPFVVLGFVPGITLRELMRKEGRMPPARVRALLAEIAKGLTAIHKAGVSHLDLKPENIMVSDPGESEERVTLIDFGIARLKATAASDAMHGGSARYMAPEQLSAPSAQCDIYTLALLTVEMLTGNVPTSTRPPLPAALGERTIDTIYQNLRHDPAARSASVAAYLKGVADEGAPRTFRPWMAVALLALSGFFAWLLYRPVKSQPGEYAKPVAALGSLARELHASFTPDGETLFFERGAQWHEQIYRMPTRGGDARLVVGNQAEDEQQLRPHVSPDGKALAFLRIKGLTQRIILKDLETSAEQALNSPAGMNNFSFAPSSKYIVSSFRQDDGNQTLAVIDIEAGQWRVLNTNCSTYHPSVSPDGKWIAYACRWAQGSDDIFLLPVNAQIQIAGRPVQLTFNRGRIDDMQWTPDSKSILYVGGTLGEEIIHRVYLSAPGQVHPVLPEYKSIEGLSVARGRNRIAFTQHLSDSNVWTFTPGQSQPKHLVATSYEDEECTESPDGKHLLYVSASTGYQQLWYAHADGSAPQRVGDFQSAEEIVALWAENSRDFLLSIRSKDLGRKIYRGELRDGEPSALTLFADDAMASSFSRDGKWLYMVERRNGERRVVRMAYPGGGKRTPVVEPASYGMESPDGKYFYYSRQNERLGLWRMPLPHGPSTQVIAQLVRRTSFTLSPDGILFLAPGVQPNTHRLQLQSYAPGSTPRDLLQLDHPPGWGLHWSIPHKRVIFTQIDVDNSDVLLVDWFR